jgi:6-pyruvoyltetrahydropterin/6-carboxytetrahydropterin synthase
LVSIIQQKYERSKNFFSASHFLPGFSKCDRIHGHDYAVKVTIDYHTSNSRHLIDFRDMNTIIQSIIKKLDHKILLPGNSSTIHIQSVMDKKNWLVRIEGRKYSFPQKDVFILKKVSHTTAENLAKYFHEKISQEMEKIAIRFSELQLRVAIAETNGNEASYSDTITN